MADFDAKRKSGDQGNYPMGVATVGAGNLTMINAQGYAIPGADTAACTFVGVAREAVDNSAGSAGDLRVNVWRKGCFLFNIVAATIADVGKAVYLDGVDTVALAATTDNDIPCGKISEFEDATHVWVDIDREVS